MSEISQAAEDLFFKLRNRFPKINMGDENGKDTVDPNKARFFNFVYTDKESNRAYGRITTSLIDGASLKVFFDTAITDRMLPEDKNYWYSFLRELRRMAKGHMLNFDVRDITKDTLSRQDLQYMTKLNPQKKDFKESLEESRVLWQRRGKFSEGTLNNVRINVVHNEKMLENPNNRLLKVDRIYLVNENGEKFLLPFKSVGGAKAMANHVSRGGNPYDNNGQLISRAIAEMRNLSRFTSVTRNRTFESSEAGDVITAAQQMKESIKRHIARLTNNSRSFSESLEALHDLISENSEDLGEVKGWFTQQTYNENLDNYLASAAGAYKKLKEGTMNRVNEAAGSVEKKIMDPNYKLVLKADSGLDKLMISRKYTSSTALLTAVLGDIANRMIGSDGDDIANFASLMGDLVSSEGEAFGQRSEPEYNKDKKLSILLAQKYMKDLGELNKNPEYAKVVRKEPNVRPSDVRKAKSAGDEFEESIMGLGEGPMSHPIEINGKQVDVRSLQVDGVDTEDYPDFSDAYFSVGEYTDGTPMSDQELDWLNDHHRDLLHQMAHEGTQGMDEANLGAKLGTAAFALGMGATAAGMMPDDKAVPYMVKPAQHGGYEVVLKRNPSHDLVNFDNKEQAYAWIKQKMQPKTKTDPFEDAVNEEPNEGNEFSGKLAAAKASGKKEFEVDGKTYPVKEGDASEPDHEDADADDKRFDDQEETKKTKGTPMKNKNIEEMRKLAGLPLMENYIYAQEEESDEHEEHEGGEPNADDKAEYDQEGRMAKSELKTAKDAAAELQSILDDEENLPEWVQAKITKAVDYLDTARDYMKDNDVEYTDESVAVDEISAQGHDRLIKGVQSHIDPSFNPDRAGRKYSKPELSKFAQQVANASQELEAAIQSGDFSAIKMALKTIKYLGNANQVTGLTDSVAEAKGKPDYLDFDKDGDKKETMKKALADKKKMKESADLTWLQAVAGIKSK